jgi:Bacteriophage tail sheath protein
MAENSSYAGSAVYGHTPGVYINELAPSPGAVVPTGVPLFIGFAQIRAQPVGYGSDGARLLRLTSWEQFERDIGPTVPGSFLGYAVRGFFENGGEYCVVVPVKVNEDQRSPGALAQALKDVFQKDEKDLRGVLDDIGDTDLVCVPDIMIDDIRRSQEIVFELQQEVLEYCKDTGERFAILDVLPGATAAVEKNTEKTILHWQELTSTDGALYFPWVRVKSLNGSGERWVPPCGHIAGVYARSDARVGFHKAPANEIVEGVLDLQTEVTHGIQSELNEVGVNCLRSFPRRGIRVWGARTLSGHRNWRYVNVRRIFLTLVRWIEHNMQDLVFEPNEPSLWDRVRDRVGGYCYELFERGALKGRESAEAFFVKCDAETNPLDVREAGQLICDVGLAPLTPAEFILIRITQSAAGSTVTLPAG